MIVPAGGANIAGMVATAMGVIQRRPLDGRNAAPAKIILATAEADGRLAARHGELRQVAR